MNQPIEVLPQISSLANVVDDCDPTVSCHESFPNLPLVAVFAGTENPNWNDLEAIDLFSLNGLRKVII